MAAIKLDGLSLPEAEEAIAEVWYCLEEYEISSPAMGVDIRADGRIAMELRFDEPIWAELVSVRLSNWMRTTQRMAEHIGEVPPGGTCFIPAH